MTRKPKSQLTPRNRPCAACPYRQDCPSGVWHEEEYAKLEQYDGDTFEQPFGVFLCHDGDRETTICRGWLDTHDKTQLLALRLGTSQGQVPQDIFDLPPSGVSVFASGSEAAEHGRREIQAPGETAESYQQKLLRRHPDLKLRDD